MPTDQWWSVKREAAMRMVKIGSRTLYYIGYDIVTAQEYKKERDRRLNR